MIPLFQTLINTQTPSPIVQSGVSFSFSDPYVVIVAVLLGFLLFLVVLTFTLRSILHRVHRVPKAFAKTILLVTLPKEGAKGGSDDRRSSTQEIAEQIAVAETLFSTIGGLKPQKGLIPFFYGREDHMSFEIVADQGKIAFYVAVPHYQQQFVEQQIQAQYSDANIEEVEDYNIFSPKGSVVGKYMTFSKDFYLPIKTYKAMESDPLNALTNVLSKLDESDGAAIQYIVRPAQKGWYKKGTQIVGQLYKGKTLSEAQSEVSGNLFGKAVAQIGKGVAESVAGKDQGGFEQQRRMTQMEEQMAKGIEEKSSKAGLEVNIRILVSSSNEGKAEAFLENIVNTFSQYNLYEFGNSFTTSGARKKEIITDFIYRTFKENKKMIVGTEEMSSLFHFPTPQTETPNILWLLAKNAPPPANLPSEGLVLGYSEYRGVKQTVRIKQEDRRRHMYIIGKSGTGKSNLMTQLARQDIAAGRGVCVVDPHGDLVDDVLAAVPKERFEDVIIFDPSDTDRPVGLNMLEFKREDQMDFAVQEMISIFYKLFPPEMIGPMFEHNMRNVMLTLMADKDHPGTIADIPRMFSDQEFQQYKASKVTDPVVKAFWEKEMAQTSDFHKSEMLGYLISKVGRFVENEMMRNIIGQPRSGFDFRDVMDQQKILLVNLAKGKIGEVNSNLLGLIVVSKIQMAAMARADMPKEDRKDFYLYIDEFQNFVTDSIAIILSEARKYALNLVMAHQYVGQLVQNNDTKIRDAVFGNAGTIASFKIGVDDAETIAKEFAPVFNEYDVVNIEKGAAYIKLLIDNTSAKAFKLKTYLADEGYDKETIQSIKELSRLKYGREKAVVTEEILERTQLGNASTKVDVDLSEISL